MEHPGWQGRFGVSLLSSPAQTGVGSAACIPPEMGNSGRVQRQLTGNFELGATVVNTDNHF